MALWAYSDWINDEYYYDQLTDWESEYIKNFEYNKKLLDLEFPNPSISTTAIYGDEQWLICPICMDAWESTAKTGMVECPLCKNMMHNPRYNRNEP